MKFNLKNWLIFILISSPFIDLANGILKFLLGYDGISPGQVIRIGFWFINLIVLLRIDFKKFKWTMYVSIFIAIKLISTIFTGYINNFGQIFAEVTFDIKFLYVLTLLMLISSAVKLKKIKLEVLEKYTSNSIFITAAILIITTVLNLNVSSYGTNIGSKGLFIEINSVAASLLIGLGLQFIAYSRNYKSKINLFKVMILFVALFMLGTKSALVFAILISGYFFLKFIVSQNKRISFSAVLVVVLVALGIVIFFMYGNGNDIIMRLIYFYKKMNFMSFLISGRDMMLTAGFAVWSTSVYYILMGTGFKFGSQVIGDAVTGRTLIEMDFFDVYYFFGSIIGTIVLIVFGYILIKSIFTILKRGTADYRGYGVTYIAAFVCAALGGHVLFSPMAGMYFGILYILNMTNINRLRNKKQVKIVHAGPDLKEQGGVVTVMRSIIDLDFKDKFKLEVLPTFTSTHKLITFLKAVLKYFFLCILKKPDIIHVHMASKGSFYRKAILILISDLFNVKIVIHLHGACFREFYSSLGKFMRRYCRSIFNRADKVIVLTESWIGFAEVLVKDRSKIEVVSNFVKISEKVEKVNDDNPIKILFLGRLGKRKGTYLVIKAADILNQKGYDFKIILAGDGEIEKCKNKIQLKGLEDKFEVTGWIDNVKKEEYLKNSDILVLPSYFESFGMSLIEGMSYCIPVIAANAGAMPEVVTDNKEGLIIEPGDYEDLAEALIFLIEHPEKRIRMGNNGYERVKREFSDKSAFERFNKIYEELGM